MDDADTKQDPKMTSDTTDRDETVVEETQSASVPAASRDAFREAMDDLSSNLANTAIQIREDKFQKAGIGSVGTVFRLMAASEGKKEEEELWSSLLNLTSMLWQNEFHEASVKLLKDSQLRLSPPLIYKDSIAGSITFGEDYMLYLRANERFSQGDTEGAQGIIRQMSEQNRRPMEAEFKTCKNELSRSRRFAFIAAGIAGAFCVVASIGSYFAFRDLVENPHTMTLPAFEMPDFKMPTDTQTGARTVEPEVPSNSPISNDPAPTHGELTNAADEQSISSDVIFNEGDNASVNSDEVTQSPSLPPLPIESDMKMEDEITSLPSTAAAEIGGDEISRCGLALRVSSEASVMALDSGDPIQVQRAEEFQAAFLSACQSVPASSIQSAGEDFLDQDVLDYARGVIFTE